MAKKKVKGGKKGKAAQPKAIPIQAYDLEIISKEDLKKYVASLEKELALMRKDCAFYNANKSKIMEFLDSRRNIFMMEKRMSVVNNAAMDDTIEQLRKFPVKCNELQVFESREKARQRLGNVFDDFVANSSAEADHLDREHVLKQQIAERNKLLESDQFFCAMTLMDMKETYQNVLEDMDSKYGRKLEGILRENVDKCLKGNQKFTADKVRTLISIWEIGERCCPSEMKESYISEMKRMQDFFHEISSNNSEVIKRLRKKLADLLIENQSTDFKLKQMLLENIKLENLQPGSLLHAGTRVPSARVSQDEKNLMKLQYKNETLSAHLRLIKVDLRNLKKQFITATRKIHQKAEFKAFVTEEIIRMTLQRESLESGEEDAALINYERVIKDRDKDSQTTDDMINVFNLSVESSDTLFVPPVYHEFWDSSIKYT